MNADLLVDIKEKLKALNCNIDETVNWHLAIFDSITIKKVESGKKKYESRWQQTRNRPYGRVNSGDIVFIKESCGKLVGYFTVGSVYSYTIDSHEKIETIISKFDNDIVDVQTEVASLSKYKYATYMEILNYKQVEPFSIRKKDCQTWICF